MKRIGTTSLLLFCIWSLIFGQVPVWDWVNAIHSPDTEIATDMVADPLTGDVYLVGDWKDSLAATIPSGGSESTDFEDTFGGTDGFVVKLDRNGNVQWAFKMGGEDDDHISAVHLDRDGNFYITGYISPGVIRFTGTGSLIADSVYHNIGSLTFYLVKYNHEGKLLWARYSEGNARVEGLGIGSNSSGVFACGVFKNTVVFGSLPERITNGGEDMFLVKYTTDGLEQWMISGQSDKEDYGRDIVCDEAEIYITGEFYGDQLSMSNAAGDIVTSLPNSSEGESEIFISCYSNEGVHLWSNSVASPEDDYCYGITMDQASLYLTGSIGAPAIFPLYPGNPVPHTGDQDAFVCAISRTNGSTGWVSTLTDDSGDDQVSNDISLDPAGNLYITGYYQSEIHADPDTDNSRGDEDVFVASYSIDGVYGWLKTAGSSNTDHGTAISGVYPGSIFVAGGYSSDQASFDAINLPADGNMNAFVGRLLPPCVDAIGGTLSVSDTAVCEGEVLSLALDDHFGDIQWQSSAPGINAWSQLRPDLSDSITFIPSFSADYRALLTSGTCEADSSNVIHVRVIPLPLVDAGSDITINVGDSIQLNGSGGDSVRWDPDYRLSDPSIPDPFADPWMTTTYFLTAFVSNRCYATDSVTVTVISCFDAVGGTLSVSDTAVCEGEMLSLAITDHSGQIQWQSSPPGMNTWSQLRPDLVDSITIFPSFSADYRALVTSDTCNADSSNVMYVRVIPVPLVDAGSNITLSAGDIIQLNGSGGVSVRWDPDYRLSDPDIPDPFADPWFTTSYYLTAWGPNGCSAMDSMIVTVLPPDFAYAGEDITICQGDSTRLQASGGDLYSWEPVGSLDLFDFPDPWATPQLTTTYVVQVTNAVGLTDTDTVTVFVHFRPAVFAGEDISVCTGIEAQLSASGTGDFAWFPQDQVTDPSQPETMAIVDNTTTFRVVLTDLNGCSSTAYVTVFAVDPPLVDAGPDQELTSRFESALDASIGPGETGRWSVVSGYGAFVDPQSPTTSVMDMEIGENVFEWVVSNGVCPEVSDQVSIMVNDFVIPTVITPNGDGKNDLFHVENIESFTSSELVVLNRWGFEVYRSAPYLNNWGGTDQNMEALTEDTYYIVLKISANDTRKGYVMILR